MSGYKKFAEHFDHVLEEGEKQWLAHEQRRFLEHFATQHGPHLIAGLERLLHPLLHSHIKLLGNKTKTERPGGRAAASPGNKGGDRFDRASSVMDKAEALARRQHEIEIRLRDDFPDEADNIIKQLREMIDMALYENEGGEG